jgi:hypothetical protein
MARAKSASRKPKIASQSRQTTDRTRSASWPPLRMELPPSRIMAGRVEAYALANELIRSASRLCLTRPMRG